MKITIIGAILILVMVTAGALLLFGLTENKNNEDRPGNGGLPR